MSSSSVYPCRNVPKPIDPGRTANKPRERDVHIADDRLGPHSHGRDHAELLEDLTSLDVIACKTPASATPSFTSPPTARTSRKVHGRRPAVARRRREQPPRSQSAGGRARPSRNPEQHREGCEAGKNDIEYLHSRSGVIVSFSSRLGFHRRTLLLSRHRPIYRILRLDAGIPEPNRRCSRLGLHWTWFRDSFLAELALP